MEGNNNNNKQGLSNVPMSPLLPRSNAAAADTTSVGEGVSLSPAGAAATARAAAAQASSGTTNGNDGGVILSESRVFFTPPPARYEASRSNDEDDAGPSRPAISNSGGMRQVTPVRVRPHSQPRSRPQVVPDAAVVVPLRARARYVGRRKERRWENSRLLNGGGGGAMAAAAAAGPHPGATVAEHLEELVLLAGKLKIESRSNFEGLVSGDHNEMRDDFIRCSGKFESTKVSIKSHVPTGQLSSARERFARVERKLRHELITTGVRTRFTQFIGTFENVLLGAFESAEGNDLNVPEVSAFSDTHQSLEALLDSLQFALDPTWDEKPSVVTTSISRTSNSNNKDKNRGKRSSQLKPAKQIKLCFRSGVYRVLAHAVCEFYGLISVSSGGKGRRGGGGLHRVMTITHPGMPHARIGDVDISSGRMVVSPSLACFLVDNYYTQDKDVAALNSRSHSRVRTRPQQQQQVIIAV